MSDDDPNSTNDFFDGLRTIFAGADRVRQAAPAVLSAVDGVVERLTSPETLHRAAATGFAAVTQHLAEEARAAASRPRPPPAPADPAQPDVPAGHKLCRRHGVQPYKATLVCTATTADGHCGRVWQMHDASKPHFAPVTCTCGAKLLPGGPGQHSAKDICSVCADNILARPDGRAVRRT
jgi:hypothetical protein